MGDKKTKKQKKAQDKALDKADKKNRKKAKALSKKVTAAADLSVTAKKMIGDAEKLEATILDAEEKFQQLLDALVGEMGTASFEHPTTGEHRSIMYRSGWWWRKKPGGNKGKNKKK